MDSKQFDELVARLAKGPSRREALKGIAGGALAAVGVSAVAESKSKKTRADAKKKKGRIGAEACIQTGKQCPSKKPRGRRGKGGKKAKNLGCDKCCQGVSETIGGVTRCTCRPSGTGASECLHRRHQVSVLQQHLWLPHGNRAWPPATAASSTPRPEASYP